MAARPPKPWQFGCLGVLAFVPFVAILTKCGLGPGSAPPVALFALVVGVVALRQWLLQRRFRYLVARFGLEAAKNVHAGILWQGATMDMVAEMLGGPEAVDEKVMATRVRHVWKYGQIGRRRFAARITFDDGVVVGWEHSGG